MGDDIRKMLGRIRNLEKKGEKISLTEVEANDVKELLNKKIITTPEVIKENYNTVHDKVFLNESHQDISSTEQREEENKFKDIVSKLCKFDKIKVFPENVEWSGFLLREKINWIFTLEDANGCYINTTDFTQLNDESLDVIRKLKGYYQIWSDDWSSRLTGTSPEESDEIGSIEPGEEIKQ